MSSSTENKIELSVVMPVYNESSCVEKSLGEVIVYLSGLNIDYEVIVVDDGSTDVTLEKINNFKEERMRVFSYCVNKGKGYAVNLGMLQCRGKYHLFLDSDLSTPVEMIGKFLDIIRKGQYDVLTATRKQPGSLIKAQQPLNRRFLGRGFILFARLLTGLKYTDFTCGFKMFTKSACEIIFIKQRIFNWAFDVELLYIARIHNLKALEVPVVWSDRHRSRVHMAKDIVGSLAALFSLRANHKKSLYK